MQTKEIIAEAERLLAEEKTEQAKELLLDQGFISQNDPVIQAEYSKLIPESIELKKERKESLSELFDKSVEVRRKASDYIFKQGRKEYKGERAAWMGDPRTIDILFEALKDEDAKVVENITGALWTIGMGGRYLTDLRVYPKMLELLQSSNKETAKYAAFGLRNFSIDEKADVLLDKLKTETRAVNIEAIINNFFRTVSRQKQEEILPELKRISAAKKNLKNREAIEKCIGRLENASD